MYNSHLHQHTFYRCDDLIHCNIKQLNASVIDYEIALAFPLSHSPAFTSLCLIIWRRFVLLVLFTTSRR